MTLKFLYTTDIHGNECKYDKILNRAIKEKIKVIHLGADILPKGYNLLRTQEEFIQNFLKRFYKKAEDNGIKILASFGNDDLYCLKDTFKEFGSLLDENPETIAGYTFKSYNFVPDYPFPLKTACKLDSKDWCISEKYRGKPVEFIDKKIHTIKNIKSYFLKKGTIEEDLKSIKVNNKTIMATHSPPSKIGLDACGYYLPYYKGMWVKTKEVGSDAIYHWTERTQPLLLLCGHLHESPKISRKWRGKIGETLVIQPGQSIKENPIVTVWLNDMKVRSSLSLEQ